MPDTLILKTEDTLHARLLHSVEDFAATGFTAEIVSANLHPGLYTPEVVQKAYMRNRDLLDALEKPVRAHQHKLRLVWYPETPSTLRAAGITIPPECSYCALFYRVCINIQSQQQPRY